MVFIRLITFLTPCLLLSSCWPTSVSFKDEGSMHSCLKQFYMPVVENDAPNSPINYETELTEAIKSGVQNNTRLLLAEESDNPEVFITGELINYAVTPVVLQEDDNSASNRLTVSAKFLILYSCPDEPYELEMNLTSTRFADYDSQQDVDAVQDELLEDINAQIVQDVINKLLSNW